MGVLNSIILMSESNIYKSRNLMGVLNLLCPHYSFQSTKVEI